MYLKSHSGWTNGSMVKHGDFANTVPEWDTQRCVAQVSLKIKERNLVFNLQSKCHCPMQYISHSPCLIFSEAEKIPCYKKQLKGKGSYLGTQFRVMHLHNEEHHYSTHSQGADSAKCLCLAVLPCVHSPGPKPRRWYHSQWGLPTSICLIKTILHRHTQRLT